MTNTKKKKQLPAYFNKLYPILLIFATIFMGIGYASNNQITLGIQMSASAKQQNGIFISEINIKEKKDAISHSNTGSENLFYTNLTLSTEDIDSYITYEIKIHNSNQKNYLYKGYLIEEDFYSNNNITFEVTNVNQDDILNSNDDIVIYVKFKYMGTTLPSENTLKAYIRFNFEVEQENILYKRISSSAVADNIQSSNVSSETGIDFHSESGTSNGKGIYLFSPTQNDQYPIYYYRGDIEDNNVKFAGYCWKIVRTTETGGIKLIYNGSPGAISNDCLNINVNSQQVNMNKFSESSTSPSDVGFMQGTKYIYNLQNITANTYMYGSSVKWDGSKYILQDSTSLMLFGDGLTSISNKYHYTCFNTTGTCTDVYYIYYTEVGAYYFTFTDGKTLEEAKADMFSNTTSSAIKISLENFYSDESAGLINYADRLENTIWCNDRTTYSGGLHSETDSASSQTYFMNYYKLNNKTYQPNLGCERLDDQFSLKVDNGGRLGYGNNMLTYPIGILTVDELMLAGSTTTSGNNYLNSGLSWWTLSPATYQYYNSYNYVVGSEGELQEAGLVTYNNIGIRPVISLRQGISYKEGTGTLSDPYIIE